MSRLATRPSEMERSSWISKWIGRGPEDLVVEHAGRHGPYRMGHPCPPPSGRSTRACARSAWRGALGGKSGGHRLDGHAHLGQVPQEADIRAGQPLPGDDLTIHQVPFQTLPNARAGPLTRFDQPLLGEHPGGLPNDRSAHTELIGEDIRLGQHTLRSSSARPRCACPAPRPPGVDAPPAARSPTALHYKSLISILCLIDSTAVKRQR